MSSALEQAGATREPSEYATLSMDRAITGLWTQRSPLRDADVPYLYGKFYSASRFDSLIDGINREITSRLTMARRPGNSIWNANMFPAINSFYAWKRIVSGSEVIRIMVDGADGNIYDATANTKTTIFAKGGGAGKARFQSVNTALYFADGVENKKYLQPATWTVQNNIATTQYSVGTTVIDSNGDLEYLASMKVGTITSVQVAGYTAILTFASANFYITPGTSFILTGLSGASFLNNLLLFAATVTVSGIHFIVTAAVIHVPYASTGDTGIATSFDVGVAATTGGTQPVWGAPGATTADGPSSWVNYGTPIYDWGPPNVPTQAPNYTGNFGGILATSPLSIWQPNTPRFGSAIVIMDNNGNIQTQSNSGVTGSTYPNFKVPSTVMSAFGGPLTADAGVTWVVSYWLGSKSGSTIVPQLPGTGWSPSTAPVVISAIGGDVLVDSNGNLQLASSGSGNTGATVPTWNTAINGSTVDNSITWINLGPYLALAFGGWQYGYAFHEIDGSVSTLSPLTSSTHGVVDGIALTGNGSANAACDSIWIFRTATGQPTPVFLASIANPGASTWAFTDIYADANLTPQLPAPQAQINNPPPIGMTAPTYHLGRIFAIYQNAVIASGGPNTIVGNGFTSFAPLSVFPIPEQPIRLFSGTTGQGPALFIWGTSKIWVILGAGTPTSPFQQASKYMDDVGILSYDAVHIVGSTAYAFTGKNKCVSLDPGAGYVEVGFPIGDQFKRVTTGQGGKTPNSGAPVGALYSPSSTFVTWAELSSGDTAVYVSDGSVGWFRFSPVASPESGFLWSPRAVIVGGTSAVQGIETASGITQLLIGPHTSGPILFRDSTVSADNGVAYPSYDTKGNIVLCPSGEVAEIAHIAVKSAAVGKRPVVGLLLGEISATLTTPFDWLNITSADPPILPASVTMYSDRYVALQNGIGPKCDNFQLCLDYGTQAAADETLLFSVYGAKHAERRQQ